MRLGKARANMQRERIGASNARVEYWIENFMMSFADLQWSDPVDVLKTSEVTGESANESLPTGNTI